VVELSMLAAELKTESRSMYDVESDTLLPLLSELMLFFLACLSAKATCRREGPVGWILLASLSAAAAWRADSDIMKLGYWLAIVKKVSLL
jgi:hypothetical protein